MVMTSIGKNFEGYSNVHVFCCADTPSKPPVDRPKPTPPTPPKPERPTKGGYPGTTPPIKKGYVGTTPPIKKR